VRLSGHVPQAFRAGHEDVSLHPLQVGSQVIAGTVIGHLGAASAEGAATPIVAPAPTDPGNAGGAVPTAAPGAPAVTGPQARMIFQIRPNGVGAPLIDPKPILDGWVRLEGSLIYRATGKHRFPAASSVVPGSKLPRQGAVPQGVVPRGAVPQGAARLAGALTVTLTPGQWLRLTARLGAIPDPVVAGGHSTASIPTAKGKGNGNR
jgi:hypothetical protein